MRLAISNNEVKPALPLHQGEGWIYVSYKGSTDTEQVNLKTLIEDANKITDFWLKDAAATTALIRIIISITYHCYLSEVSKPDWIRTQAKLIEENVGFNSQWVNSYFERYSDRFYLIHPRFPFMQDPSLFELHSHKNEKITISNTKGISNLYPLAPSTAKEDGAKTLWDLPEEEVYSSTLAQGLKKEILATSLLHHLYSHAAVNRGSRSFYQEDDAGNVSVVNSSETANAAHAFRTAISFVPKGSTVFQTIILAMKQYDSIKNDIPRWELDADPYTGFTGKVGYDVFYADVVSSRNFESPRSSVNMTHLALLFIPEIDEEGEQLPEGGQIRQLRRIAFNFKNFKDTNGKKLSFPITWNPFVAITKDGKALKRTEGLSPNSYLEDPNISRVQFMVPSSKIVKMPGATLALKQSPLSRTLPSKERRLSVLIHAGESAQEKTYSNFIIDTKIYENLSPNEIRTVEDWFELAGKLNVILNWRIDAILDVNSTKSESRPGISMLYWQGMTEMFQEAVSGDVKSQIEYKKEIVKFLEDIFDSFAEPYALALPLKCANERNKLRNMAYKAIERRN